MPCWRGLLEWWSTLCVTSRVLRRDLWLTFLPKLPHMPVTSYLLLAQISWLLACMHLGLLFCFNLFFFYDGELRCFLGFHHSIQWNNTWPKHIKHQMVFGSLLTGPWTNFFTSSPSHVRVLFEIRVPYLHWALRTKLTYKRFFSHRDLSHSGIRYSIKTKHSCVHSSWV